MSEVNPTDSDKNVLIGDGISNNEKKRSKDKSKSLSTKVVVRRLVRGFSTRDNPINSFEISVQ